MDGFTFVERIRSDPALHDIPAILVTSRAAPEDRRRGTSVGAHGYISQGRVRSGRAPGDDQAVDGLGRWQDPRAGRRGFADGAPAACRNPVGRPGDRGGRRGRGRQSARSSSAEGPARRHHDGHDAAGDDRPGGDRIHHGALPDADPGGVVFGQSRRSCSGPTTRWRPAPSTCWKSRPGDEPDGEWERKFISPVKLVSRIRVITHPRGKAGGNYSRPAPERQSRHPIPRATGDGARSWRSARRPGGPAADRRDPARPAARLFDCPILLVLHINEPFGAAFADWLDAQTERRVAMPATANPSRRPAGAWSWRRPAGTSSCATAACG